MFILIGLETYQSKIYFIGNCQANEREIGSDLSKHLIQSFRDLLSLSNVMESY